MSSYNRDDNSYYADASYQDNRSSDDYAYGDDGYSYGGDGYSYGGDGYSYGGDGHTYGDGGFAYGDESQRYNREDSLAPSVGSFKDNGGGNPHDHMYSDRGPTAGSYDPHYADSKSLQVEGFVRQGREVYDRRADFAENPKKAKRMQKEKIAEQIGSSSNYTMKSSNSKESRSKSRHSKNNDDRDGHDKSSHDRSRHDRSRHDTSSRSKSGYSKSGGSTRH